MKKFYICVILLFSFFITSNVKADQINIGINGINNISSSNLTPYTYVTDVNLVTNSLVLNGSAVDGTIQSGQNYQVVAKFCSNKRMPYTLTMEYLNSARLNIKNYDISSLDELCQVTDPNGNVFVGNSIWSVVINFSIGNISSNGTFQANFHITPSSGNIGAYFLSYDIFNQEQINDNQNTQEIINNQDSNTDRLINNANSNSQAEIDATNRNTQAVNGVNNSINNTDTTGSENALSSIINDPAFQDNTGINSIITLPVTMISSLSNSCQPISLTIPFLNSSVELPCFRSIITQHMPLVANLISIVVNGFILYRILIDIVGIVKSARNPDEDRLDVLEL